MEIFVNLDLIFVVKSVAARLGLKILID